MTDTKNNTEIEYNVWHPNHSPRPNYTFERAMREAMDVRNKYPKGEVLITEDVMVNGNTKTSKKVMILRPIKIMNEGW